MAQLPPKIPSAISNNWPYFAHHPALHAPASQPSWVDEFLDLPTGRLSHRRRSTIDSVAFLEAPLLDEGGGFDRLNDDEIMSMFSDEVPPPASPSTPSEHSGIHEDKPAAAGAEEAQSACNTQLEAAAEPLADAKRVKRQSAQRSRVRKLQYISELERSVTTLQTEVSELSPRVALLDHQRSILTIGNSHLKQRIAALAQDKIFKDAHQEALKKEIERLSQIYQQQNLDKMGASTKKELLS